MPADTGRVAGLHPRVFALLVFGLTVLAVTTPAGAWTMIALAAAAGLGLAAALRVPAHALCHALVNALPFLLLLAITFPFSTPGAPAVRVLGLTASREGLTLALSVMARATAAILLLATLRHALGEARLLATLRGLGVPATLILVLSLALRFAGLIGQEMRRLLRTARSRSPRTLGVRTSAMAAALVLVRSLDRSERVHRAMAARGFDGQALAHASPPLAATDWLAAGVLISLLAAALIARPHLG